MPMAANSAGPVPVENAWDAFADDQLGLMDHLGIREFFFMGYCIGGCFAGKLLQRAPERVVAAVFCQTVGHRPEDPEVMVRHSQQNWLAGFPGTTTRGVDGDDREVSPQPLPRAARFPLQRAARRSSAAAGRRSWSCRTTRRRIRCRPRSTLRHWRPTPRSRSSRGASRRNSRHARSTACARSSNRTFRCAAQRSSRTLVGGPQSFSTPARAQSSSSCALPPPTPQAPIRTPWRKIGTAPWP